MASADAANSFIDIPFLEFRREGFRFLVAAAQLEDRVSAQLELIDRADISPRGQTRQEERDQNEEQSAGDEVDGKKNRL